MIRGIKTLENGDFCAYCNAKVNLEIYNFCPKCGNPLTDEAIRLRDQQDKKLKIELVGVLAEKIENKKVLEELATILKDI